MVIRELTLITHNFVVNLILNSKYVYYIKSINTVNYIILICTPDDSDDLVWRP